MVVPLRGIETRFFLASSIPLRIASGTSNAHNVVNATMAGLQALKRESEVAKLRGKTVEEIIS